MFTQNKFHSILFKGNFLGYLYAVHLLLQLREIILPLCTASLFSGGYFIFPPLGGFWVLLPFTFQGTAVLLLGT